jgi:hypothetical protein
MNARYLPVHLSTVHHLSRLQAATYLPPTSQVEEVQESTDQQEYEISFPRTGFPVLCPVRDCQSSFIERSSMHSHFAWRHCGATLRIQQQKDFQACPICGKLLHTVSARHLASKTCKKTASHKQGLLDEALKTASRGISLHVGSRFLETVDRFQYLGRILTDNDSDSAAMLATMKSARDCWGRIRRLLCRDGVCTKTMARFYLAVVQAKLLNGSETWVLTKRDMDRLERFHAHCARNLACKPIRRLPDGTWLHPPTEQVLQACKLSPISTYIAKRKTSLLHHAKLHSLVLPRCLEVLPVAQSAHRHVWWRGLA